MSPRALKPDVKRNLRSFAFIACLAVLADPLGALGPTWALAQTAETLEASRAKKAQKGKSNTPRIRLRHPASTRNEGLAPVPPTFYSLSQLGDHLYSVRWELAAVGAGLVAVGLRDWDWGGSEFQFIEEGWFAKNTPHGGMDKIGHAFSTYVIADILTDRIRANASNPAGAPITGALVAFGIMGLGETLDGFTGKHRFSREDIVANGVGAAFSILRNSDPWLAGEARLAADVHAGELRAARHHSVGGIRHPSALPTPALHHGPERQRVRDAQEHASALRRTARRLRCARL